MRRFTLRALLRALNARIIFLPRCGEPRGRARRDHLRNEWGVNCKYLAVLARLAGRAKESPAVKKLENKVSLETRAPRLSRRRYPEVAGASYRVNPLARAAEFPGRLVDTDACICMRAPTACTPTPTVERRIESKCQLAGESPREET